jgi:hypothetical protein
MVKKALIRDDWLDAFAGAVQWYLILLKVITDKLIEERKDEGRCATGRSDSSGASTGGAVMLAGE